MIIPFDVWLKIRQGKDLDIELMMWNISKNNTASTMWIETKGGDNDE